MARPGNFSSIYLDSSALLSAIQAEAGHEPIAEVLRLASQGRLTVYASAVILVEVRAQRRGHADASSDEHALRILDSARLIDVELSRGVAMRAREYVGSHGLRPLDAIHLASAVAAETEVFWSWDGDFGKLAGSAVDGVWVDQPYEFGASPIPGI